MDKSDPSGLLDKLTEVIAAGKRPDLKDLAAAVRHDIKEVDVLSWAAFEEVVRNAYGITEDEFYHVLLPPMFSRKGGYVDDFLPLLDKIKLRGWLRRYVNHTMIFESPTAFHFAPALTVLGSSLKRNVWIDQGIYKVFPAIATFLLGPSGYTHKSTAGSYAVSLGEASGRVNRLMDEGSPEALKRNLHEVQKREGKAIGLLFASEFSTLMPKADYAEHTAQVLTDLFDARPSLIRKTNTTGDISLKEIALSAIMCSNEEWATSAVPASAFGGGMMSRILVWFQASTDRLKARPLRGLDVNVIAAERQELVEMLAKTGLVMGEFYLTTEADDWFDARYRYIREHRPEDERMEPLWSRYGDWLMRLAMLIKVSDMIEDAYEQDLPLAKRKLEIELQQFKQADAILSWIMRYLPKVYAFLGLTPFGAEATKIMQFIARRGGRATEREIGRKLKISKKALEEQLGTLIHYGYLIPDKTGVGGTEYILDRDPFEV